VLYVRSVMYASSMTDTFFEAVPWPNSVEFCADCELC
jgi:hypothetical protein